MFLLLSAQLVLAAPGSVNGWSTGLSTAAPGDRVTAITRYGGGYAVILDGLPTLWYWDGLATWSELDTIADSGEAHALALYKNNLYVGGHFVDSDGSSFAFGVYKSSAGDTTPILGPCATADCGTVYAIEPVDAASALDGLWLGGAEIFGGDTIGAWPVLQLAPAGPDFRVAAAGLGDATVGTATVRALSYGDDPAYDTTSDADSVAVVGSFQEDGIWGIARYHPFGGYITDFDHDGWVPVGGGVAWSGLCSGCADVELTGVSWFQGELYATGPFTTLYNTGLVSTVSANGLVAWDGAAFHALEGASAGGYGLLRAFGDEALYIGNPTTVALPELAGGLLRYDGAALRSVEGGLWGLDIGTDGSLGAGPLAIDTLYLEDDGLLTIGGVFTHAGRLGADLYSGALLNSAGIAQWDPARACEADLNADGLVDRVDLAALFAAWGEAGVADLTADGIVDSNDQAALLADWGPCP